MRTILRTTLLTSILLAGISLFGEQLSIGVSIGPPPPPRAMVVRPRTPGPDFVWVEGYWYPVGHHYKWHGGYWTRPPYPDALWVMPHYDGSRFFEGYWEGREGHIAHDHQWDRHRDRDFRGRGHEHGHEHEEDRH